ncbi:protein MAIN-LIKE 1-like [Chenopodium quinoa]|uniref:protein MAIN-LIKE 1-like n=1 Tax=Chenopodium quinoa TaxID=63459 RepID=UPI000B76F98A|nr:protein MAIN-LIKE 1-like [Chenopodium quinoa]
MWLVQGEMPGGPKDGSVIPRYAGHIATQIWMGSGARDCQILRCHPRTQWCLDLQEMYKNMTDDVRSRVDSTVLSRLAHIMHHHIDWALISAFVKRWQPDTNTFHFPFGEMTIMLHDVQYILGLPVEGAPIVERSDVASLRVDFQNFLGVGVAALVAKPGAIWDNGGYHVRPYMRGAWQRGETLISRCRVT